LDIGTRKEPDMQIQTLRFGNINYSEEHIIRFRDGMIGLAKMKDYILVESPNFPLILWLQSIQDQNVAFPLIEPYFFNRDYKITMNDAEVLSLDLAEGERSKVMVVMTIPSALEKMTVNLKAPIVFNIDKSQGTQIVLQDKTFEVRTAAFEAFTRASQALVTQSVSEQDEWMPIRLGGNEKSAEKSAAISV
jgi:flagellar assembly factor FliW